jgi:hypothetical protein
MRIHCSATALRLVALPILATGLLFAARAQDVIITLNIVPPYSAYVYDYADLTGQAVITLTNTTTELKEVRLEGSMTNTTAGLFVRTEPGHRGPQAIVLPPGGSVVLSTQPEVMDFLDAEYVTTNADQDVQQAITQTGQLPEGMYTLCVEAYDYNSTLLLSQPGGGCFSFALYYANPPIITQPVHGSEISAYMTNPVFSWTPPLGNLAGALIQYDLLVTPVFAGQNPNDAIIAARTYQIGQPVLLKENLMTNVYVRQVFDLPFEQGKTYAMQVTARDVNGMVGISNQGRSEISVFTIGTTTAPVIPYVGTTPTGTGPVIDPGVSPAFIATTLTGTLKYFWHAPSNHGAASASGTSTSVNLGALGGLDPSAVQQVMGAITDGNRSGYSGFEQHALAGATVQLVQAVQFQSAPAMGAIASPLLPGMILQPEGNTLYIQGQPSMSMAVLATSTTDGSGNFRFNVPNAQALDFGWKQGTVSTTAAYSGEFDNSYAGTFRRVLMVRVGNPARTFYAQPVQYNHGLPANRDLGLFHAQVKSYDVKVLVAERRDFQLKKSNLEVLLLRKVGSKPSLVPKDEASRGEHAANPTIVISMQQYEILARDTTNAQGMAEFRDLVRFDCATNSSSNLYYTWARPVDEFTTQWSQDNWPQPINYAYQADWSSSCFNVAQNSIAVSCTKCNLSQRDGFSTLSRTHARAFKGQDEWLYHVNRTSASKPAITATIKNNAAGTQSDLALNEPGVTWKLWRLNQAAMLTAKNAVSDGKWGARAESDEPSGFIGLQAGLAMSGKPMVLDRTGLTGPDGRIEARNLAVEGPVDLSNPIGHYWILDVTKAGFGRRIKVVNKLTTTGGTGLFGGFAGSTSASGDVGLVRPGYQYNAGEIWLDPNGRVTLVLQNEAGAAVTASAYYIDPVTGQEGQIVSAVYSLVHNRRQVTLDVPSGTNRRIVVVPANLDLYERDTVLVPNVPNTGTVTQTAVIPYKLHRIHFVVQKLTGTAQEGDLNVSYAPVAGARVELIGTNALLYPTIVHPATNAGGATPPSPQGQPLVRYTNAQGMVDFAFKVSNGESFTFRVYGAANDDLVTKEVIVASVPGKQWKTIAPRLVRGREVRGRVMLDSAAVAGAVVRYTYQGITAEATTNANGEYSLKRAPRTALTFTASKQGYLGMEYTEGGATNSAYGWLAQVMGVDQPDGTRITTLNFQLRIYGGMDFSRILGFPLEVTAFAEEPNGRARINGWVNVPDSANAIFRLKQAAASGNDLRSVRFMNITVEPDVAVNEIGVPLTKPVTLPMPLAVNEVAVGLFPNQTAAGYAYHATLRDTQHGVVLGRPSGNDLRGAVIGQVRLASASFTDNNFGLEQGASMQVVAPDGGLRPAVFASDAASWYPSAQALNVSNEQGQALQFLLHGFAATSAVADNQLYADSLVLAPRLHTALEHIPAPDNDLNLAIGRVRLSGGQLQPFTGARSFTLPLGEFSLQGTELSMNSGGFDFKGTLMASGMELAVQNGQLAPTSFNLGEMDAEDMTLMGVIPVQAEVPAQFGYDAVRPAPAWYVVVTSANDQAAGARIDGQHLDGIPDDRDVPITSIWLYSNGTQEVSLQDDIPSYRVHGITDFHLQSMTITPNLLTLSGELDLGIPELPTYTSALLYDKTPNGLTAFRLQDFAMPPSPVNGVQLAFNKGQQRGSFGTPGNQHCIAFAQDQLTIKGVISDQDPEVFKNLAYTLVKTQTLIQLTVDRDPQQSVRLGGDNPGSRILMTDVEGAMTVVAGNNGPAWNTFYIKGNMPEEMGFEAQNGQPQRMRFEVHGDLAVQDQQIKLKDIETPFGNINMVYDMQHHRLSGQVNVGGSVSGGPSMNGTAAIVIDKDGFYFMSGLNVNLPSPEITGMAFVLLGDYKTRTPEMDALLMQYSLHVQKKLEREVPAFMIGMIDQALSQDPLLGVSMAESLYPGTLLPPTYLDLFNSGRFNGFYFEAGAQIPLPVIPNFSIDCSPVATLEMGCDGGIDVRLGANFGSGAFGVGFDTYVDLYMAGGASAGVICAYGRIGLYLTVGLDGVFQTNGNYSITGNGNVQLTGNVTIGGGMCSVPCNDFSCLHFDVGGTIGLGMQANISNSGSDFRFTMGSDGTSSSRHDPPPPEN